MDALYKKWGSKIVTGEEEAPKPSLLAFRNVDKAINLIDKHRMRNSKVFLHCDVDVDGVMSGYLVKKFFTSLGIVRLKPIINKEKSHGIGQRHVDVLNKMGCDLLVIVDSGSNDIEYIKQLNMDVLVLDHHELEHNELYINDGHEKVIVNNMAENLEVDSINEWLRSVNPRTSVTLEPYLVESRMSGAMVIYETFRIFCEAYRMGDIMEEMRLHQIVPITLYSDVVKMVGDRNQWYIAQLIGAESVEGTLRILLMKLNSFSRFYSKSFILFSLSPMINKSIRAGEASKVLEVLFESPHMIPDLAKYAEQQERIIFQARKSNLDIHENYVMVDVTELGVNRNYCGVISANIAGDYGKNVVTYIVKGEYAEGSFRGRDGAADYKVMFNKIEDEDGEDTYGRGHKGAFGFRAKLSELPKIMESLVAQESTSRQNYLTIGSIKDTKPGIYHIEDSKAFKRNYELMKLAVGNSRVSSEEQILISASLDDVTLISETEKLWQYDVCGLKCKAFEKITTPEVTLYAEFQDNIEIYLRNKLI